MSALETTPPEVEAARRLRPLIEAASSEIEASGRLTEEVVDALQREHLFHMMLPRSLGGLETNPVDACRAIEEVALADGSTGWCVMLAAQSASFAGYLPETAAREVWGDGGIAAGVARPIGRAVVTSEPEDGWNVSGHWPFASGSTHATWFAGECVVYDGDRPRMRGDEEETRMVFVPRDEVVIHETWDALGLGGTASHDFTIEASFVPASHGFQMLRTEPQHPWALYRADPLIFVTHGSHALGVARGALEAARAILVNRRGYGDAPLRDVPRLQTAIAEATALIESARHWLYATSDALWRATVAAGADTTLLRARTRLATSHAARAGVQAVDLLQSALGTSAVGRGSPLERRFRDIHTAAAHVMIGPLTYEAAGRAELGLDPGMPFF
ncbi:MAG: acyl-CoA dehydrogenase family protein [Dehalococcoidia bacterium]